VRIAWDGRGLVGPRTGLGFYTYRLIKAFESLQEDWSADLFTNQTVEESWSDRVQPIVLPYPNTVRLRRFWEETWLPSRLARTKADIWHSPLSCVPAKISIPTIATIHDVAFLHYPEILPPAYRKYWTRQVSSACERADALIAVSEATRDDLLHFFDIPDDRIHVVYEAADPLYFETPEGENRVLLTRDYGLDADYLLFVGTLEPRKNLRFLLDVYREALSQKENLPTLVIVGGKGWLEPTLEMEIERLGNSVLRLGYVDPEKLHALYRNARVVLVPSRYEGFGLQAAEALASGAAVIAANLSSLPEVVGDGGLLLPLDQEVWVENILELNENDEAVSRLQKAAREQAAKFSWSKTAQETWEVFTSVLDHH